jgi:hypothetical protein
MPSPAHFPINSFYMDEDGDHQQRIPPVCPLVRDSILRRKMAERGIPGFVLEGEANEV